MNVVSRIVIEAHEGITNSSKTFTVFVTLSYTACLLNNMHIFFLVGYIFVFLLILL